MYGVCCVWFQFVFIFVFVDSSQVAETKSWGRKIDLLCGWKDTAELGKIVVQSFFSLSKPDRVAAIWNCPRGIHTLCFFSFMHICNDVCWQPRWEGLDANNTFVFPAESYFTGTHEHKDAGSAKSRGKSLQIIACMRLLVFFFLFLNFLINPL